MPAEIDLAALIAEIRTRYQPVADNEPFFDVRHATNADLILALAREAESAEAARDEARGWLELERKCVVCKRVRDYEEAVRCFDCKAVYCMTCFPTHFRDEVRALREAIDEAGRKIAEARRIAIRDSNADILDALTSSGEGGE